ncbi:thioredoxin-dependent peroxidase [Moniliophthora roreri MCA 2997]|uniref:Putative peroxiredoxin n=1 Tax=Moniliophthora roreri (strain MCA 2997) TaxID=1381753 RepID=V2X503_MONRO|nr:thioredoxin-dependent peroxidase [Moniliophthora roreri MCA 2997]
MAPSINVGDTVPEGTFSYVPYTPELENGVTTKLDIHKEWKGKKVVLFSVPGAFTPTCHVNHLPPYIQKYDEFKAKGVDVVAVVAANDAFVMSGWGRVEGVKDKILTLSDANAQWSNSLNLTVDLSHLGFGTRTARYALIINDLKVEYVGVEPAPGVTVSGADAVLSKL